MTPGKHSRLEDQRFITGQGRYASDLNLPGQVYAAFLRSDRGHATIRSIDVSAAKAAPGVLAVLTGADTRAAGCKPLPVFAPVKGVGGSSVLPPPRLAIAETRVRFVGEPVAMVVATSAAAAQDATELISVDYDDLPVVTMPADAVRPDAVQLFDADPVIPNNTIFEYDIGDKAKVDAAFKSAAKVARITLHNTRIVASPMEPRACIADYTADKDKLTFYSVTQGVAALRAQVAGSLGVSEDNVDVIAWDVGGGFGVRYCVYPEYVAVALASKQLKRPVKWVSSRSEAFLSDEHSRGVDSVSEVAMDASGKFLAMRHDFLCDVGAYCAPFGTIINTLSISNQLTGVYDLPAAYARTRCIVTNTAPIGAFRGAGRPVMSYALERLVDEAARVTGLDRVEIRRRNVVPANKFPYTAVHGKVWDSGDFAGLLEHAVKVSDWSGYAARKAESAANGKVRGLGIACYIEESGGGAAPTDETELKFGANNELSLYAVSHNHGQGHETVFAQIISKITGIPERSIRLKNGAPEQARLVGMATGGSRTMQTLGSVMHKAAYEVVEKGRKLAADRLEAAEGDIDFAEGTYRIKGTDRKVTLQQLIDQHKDAEAHPLNVRTGMKIGATYPNGCHVVEVEVDPQTGTTTIAKYTATDDMGNVINEQLLEGQVHGGIVQAVGQILTEHAHYDPASGQPLTGSFLDYAMPRAGIVPTLDVVERPMPTATNPIGAKGAGEGGNTGSLPATMSAVIDALKQLGVEHFEMPASPARVWGAIQAAKRGDAGALAQAQAPA